jgi:DNA-binding transcriptional ArsR family regulator
VPIYDPATGTGRMLALDLDPGRAGGNVHDGAVQHDHELCPGPVAVVRAQAEALAELVARCGGQVLADVSPSGGRHVYVLFGASLPWLEVRDLVRAISLRYPAVDPAPMASLGGQISPPGARHKRGGWRLLSMPLADAVAVVEHPNGPEVWAALLTEFAAELQQAESASACGFDQAAAEIDAAGIPWVPRLGGRASLGPELERVARTGRWDHSRYPGRSEARMAVLGSAAARGWQLAEVRAAIACGAWKGLAALYERRSEPGRLQRLLPMEWRKCIDGISREKNVRHRHTSDLSTRPPADQSGVAAGYGLIRQWRTAILCAAEDPQRVKNWGGRAIAVRLVLLALGQAAMVSGSSSTIEFGCRNIALHSCLSHRTVARALRLLANEPDPLIDLVSPRRLARADRYALRIPDRYAESVRWRRRRAGRIAAAHPVFLKLGGTSALVYQVLDQAEARGAEVARATSLSASATSAALRVLAEHGLAERGPGGWRRGPAALADVAESTGAAGLQREREERYRQDRESWRARLRTYQGARQRSVSARDGWWSLDDGDEYDEMCRWPVLSEDFVRGPPSAEALESA